MDNRQVFIISVVMILCFSGIVTHCTYSNAQCKQEAIKSGKIQASEIRALCAT